MKKKIILPIILLGFSILVSCNTNTDTPNNNNTNIVEPSNNEQEIKKEVVFDFTDITYITVGTEYDLTSKVTTDGEISIIYYDNNNTLLDIKPTELGIYYAKIDTLETDEYYSGSKTIKFRIIQEGWLPWV